MVSHTNPRAVEFEPWTADLTDDVDLHIARRLACEASRIDGGLPVTVAPEDCPT